MTTNNTPPRMATIHLRFEDDLQPGDILMVTVPDNTTQEHADQLCAAIANVVSSGVLVTAMGNTTSTRVAIDNDNDLWRIITDIANEAVT